MPDSLTNVQTLDSVAGALRRLDKEIKRSWLLGRNVVLAWATEGGRLSVLTAPNTALGTIARRDPGLLSAARRGLSGRALREIAERFALEPQGFDLAPALRADARMTERLDRLLRRYSVWYTKARPVALLDIVGFSLREQIDQVMLLNSLAYSLTMAERRCQQLGLAVDMARSTTGDGFYVWNRRAEEGSDIDLFALIALALIDNAIAGSGDAPLTAPHLRAGFIVGGHFNFFQADGPAEGVREYIVGETTIGLARMLDGAEPGQILLGETGDASDAAACDGFMARVQQRLDQVVDVPLSGSRVGAIKAYATGDRDGRGGFVPRRYTIVDKHGVAHGAYNLKVNIHLVDSPPIFLGLSTADLDFLRQGPEDAGVSGAANARRERRAYSGGS